MNAVLDPATTSAALDRVANGNFELFSVVILEDALGGPCHVDQVKSDPLGQVQLVHELRRWPVPPWFRSRHL